MRESGTLIVLARELELRWRMRQFLGYLASALSFSMGASVLLVIANIAFAPEMPVWRLIAGANGASIAICLILAAIQPKNPLSLLGDADRVYDTREILSSAADFQDTSSPPRSKKEEEFRGIVISQGEAFAEKVDPATVYPVSLPRRSSVVMVLLAAIGIIVLLDASGWFGGPQVELAQEGFLLEDAARRLAEQSSNDELQDLANELQRLGESLQDGQLEADEARRRIEQLAERVEEQVENLERLGEFATNQDMEIPPELESSVRTALRSGMSEGEVLEYFMSMRSEGNTLPDVMRQLEDAQSNTPPNADIELDEERVRELLDQLNLSPESSVSSDLSADLDLARRTLQQAGDGVQELSEGEDAEFGEPGQASSDVRGGGDESEQEPGTGSDMEGSGIAGQSGGDQAVEDAMDDTFARIEEANPIFRQIEGVIGDGTIRDVIIRELPSEAIAQLDESEREFAFETVIEEAVSRENVPPELQQLLRNYFLRITLGSDQGDTDEQ